MIPTSQQVAVIGDFDDLRSADIRFLEEAAKMGGLTVCLWSDEKVRQMKGAPPKFPQEERLYLMRGIRYVSRALILADQPGENAFSETENGQPSLLIMRESDAAASKSIPGFSHLPRHVVREEDLRRFPADEPADPAPSSRKKVIVTGCFDWLHSGHVRFFEEVSAFGDLYVIVGHDGNIRLLKGEGHPMFPQAERRYVAGSVRFVKEALVSTGHGWLDAEPEILRIKPDIYAVNEDGHRPVKQEYCEKNGIEYLVLKRVPAPGLPKRSSTDLRGDHAH